MLEFISRYGDYAIIIGSAILTKATLPKAFKPFAVKPFLLTVLCFAIMVVCIIRQIKIEIDAGVTANRERYSSNVGKIENSGEAPKTIYLIAGKDKFPLEGGSTTLNHMIDSTSLRIYVKNNKLYVDALILSPDTNIVVKMTANEFETNPDKVFDKNFDDSTLEVMDKKNNVVLQLQFRSGEIMVYGYFTGHGRVVVIYPIGDRGYITIEPKGKFSSFFIPPIFKYPSLTHPGEYLDPIVDSSKILTPIDIEVTDSLKKYSYIFYGRQKEDRSFDYFNGHSGSLPDTIFYATGYFIRRSNRLFFLTSRLQVSGNKSFFIRNKYLKFPDVMYIQINHDNPFHIVRWPMDVGSITSQPWQHIRFAPDVFIYEFKRPYITKDTVYSIESLIDEDYLIKNIKSGGRIAMFGFTFDGYNDFNLYPKIAILTGGYKSLNEPYRHGATIPDSFVYGLVRDKGAIYKSFGGSPLFLSKETIPGDISTLRFLFHGQFEGPDIYSGFGPEKMFAIRPKVVLEYIDKYIKAHKN